ncbi:hypothetical protein Droror1_Dr00018038 [Drosera rotundifolia]
MAGLKRKGSRMLGLPSTGILMGPSLMDWTGEMVLYCKAIAHDHSFASVVGVVYRLNSRAQSSFMGEFNQACQDDDEVQDDDDIQDVDVGQEDDVVQGDRVVQDDGVGGDDNDVYSIPSWNDNDQRDEWDGNEGDHGNGDKEMLI